MGEQQWVSVARELAGVVRRATELERERTELAVARERLERSLADLLELESDALRVPQYVEGPGEGTRLIRKSDTLTALSKAVECPRDLAQGCAVGDLVHTHYADGSVTVWDDAE